MSATPPRGTVLHAGAGPNSHFWRSEIWYHDGRVGIQRRRTCITDGSTRLSCPIEVRDLYLSFRQCNYSIRSFNISSYSRKAVELLHLSGVLCTPLKQPDATTASQSRGWTNALVARSKVGCSLGRGPRSQPGRPSATASMCG
jgi:hypothetical protein